MFWKGAREKLFTYYRKIFFGAGQDILKPKTSGNSLKNFLNFLDYYVLIILDWLDTKVFFKNRRVRTSTGRVRSRGERYIARYLDENHIAYVYEKEIILDGITLHPDFYLPKYDVTIEYWGLMGKSDEYERIYRLKTRLYRKHGIKFISLYQRHLKNIAEVLPRLLQEITGQKSSQ